MKRNLMSLAGVALASLGIVFSARADIIEARCNVYPKGENQAGFEDFCTVSHRQGNITITLTNSTYELTPSATEANTYIDQYGRLATREEIGLLGFLYRLADAYIHVRFDFVTISIRSD